MRKLFFCGFFIAIASYTSQAQGLHLLQHKVAQIFEMDGDQAKKKDDGMLVYENDTIKIAYNLWDEKGLVSVNITNKMTSNLFIDLEDSKVKVLDQKFDLWADNDTDSATAYRKSFQYTGPNTFPGVKFNPNAGMGGANMGRNLRVLTLKPGESFVKSMVRVYPLDFFNMGTRYNKKTVALTGSKGKLTDMYETNYTSVSSPVRVELTLACSNTESFVKKWNHYNRLYTSKVTEMEIVQYMGGSKDPKAESPYKNPGSFYIFAPKDKVLKAPKP